MELSSDRLQASAVAYLLDGGQTDAASVLLACSLEVGTYDSFSDYDGNRFYSLFAEFGAGARDVVLILNDLAHPITSAICEALNAAIPGINEEVQHVNAHFEVRDLDPSWRNNLAEIARGTRVNNQGVAHGSVPAAPVKWRDLNFRSQTEMRIAAALDTTGVLFLPNCLARVNVSDTRVTREVDFLVCSDGKWGILEIDGPHHHGMAAEDHDRDRLFKDYKIRVIERYPWRKCYDDALGTVQSFLKLLSKNG
jgi:hypothetical protein